MSHTLDRYAGREQSFIKHTFLTRYLQAAAYKILQGRSRTFNFVDAFAGPWRVSDNTNYSDASFDQALRTLEAVRVDLTARGVVGLRVRFCFCEKRRDAIDRLLAYAETKKGLEIYVFHGAFEDRLGDISSICQDGFTFTFIDPTGWNIRSEPILNFLESQRGEFLLNFMAEHVNRHAEYPKVAASFGRFLADPDWEDQFNALPAEWGNEKRVFHLLKNKIRATGSASFLADFPVLKPLEERVKMRLVLGTHTAKGLEVFRDVQESVERTEIETRDQLRNSIYQQVSLFTDDELAEIQQNRAGVGCPRYQQEAERLIVDLLKRRHSVSFREVGTKVLEEVPIRLTQLKALVNKLKEQSVLSFDLAERMRVPQPETPIRLNTTSSDSKVP